LVVAACGRGKCGRFLCGAPTSLAVIATAMIEFIFNSLAQ